MMRERRHGGFAAAVVSCEDSSSCSLPVACHSSAGAVEDVRGDLPTTGSSVIAVAGGLDGPLRSGGRVLASAEWLCGDRNRWYPLSSMNSKRYGCASASLPNQLIVVGGSAGRRQRLSARCRTVFSSVVLVVGWLKLPRLRQCWKAVFALLSTVSFVYSKNPPPVL